MSRESDTRETGSPPTKCLPNGEDLGRGPLAGLRVLDLSALLPGPFCTLVLADLGADVIKIEPPTGDGVRHSPTEIHPVVNRNKRSIVLDLKAAKGLEDCLRLAATCDVIIEGFRPGVVERLGVGYEQVRIVRPDVVYCSISGFGQTGPLVGAPGHDVNYLAASGALAYSGDWQRSGPRRSGLPLADLSASMYAAVSILAALRRRDATGKGAYIDIGMADCAMALASVRGGESQRLDDAARMHLFPSNGLFACADARHIALGAVEDRFWHAFSRVAMHFDERLGDPRFATEHGRREHGDELTSLLEALFASADSQTWIGRLASADLPVQLVLTLDEAVRTEQVTQRGIVQWHGGQRHVLFPALWDGRPVARVVANAPDLNRHSCEVLDELERIEAGKRSGPATGAG